MCSVKVPCHWTRRRWNLPPKTSSPFPWPGSDILAKVCYSARPRGVLLAENLGVKSSTLVRHTVFIFFVICSGREDTARRKNRTSWNLEVGSLSALASRTGAVQVLLRNLSNSMLGVIHGPITFRTKKESKKFSLSQSTNGGRGAVF